MDIPPHIPNTKKWKEVLEHDYGFKHVQKLSELPDNILWSTSCSKTKKEKNKDIPSKFYLGKYNKIFYNVMEQNNIPYGVLSDKYGIHMFDEKLDYYDIHPSNLSLSNKKKLGKLIQKKVKKYGFKELVFYYPSPLLSIPYFEMLWYSKLPVYYVSSIFKIFS